MLGIFVSSTQNGGMTTVFGLRPRLSSPSAEMGEFSAFFCFIFDENDFLTNFSLTPRPLCQDTDLKELTRDVGLPRLTALLAGQLTPMCTFGGAYETLKRTLFFTMVTMTVREF